MRFLHLGRGVRRQQLADLFVDLSLGGVYRDGRPHKGIFLMRLSDERLAVKIETMERLLRDFAETLPGRFVVVSEDRIRFAAEPAH